MRLNVGGMRARRWLYLAVDKGRTLLTKEEGGFFGVKKATGLRVPSLSIDRRNGL